MIDLKAFRDNPQPFIDGARAKNIEFDFDQFIKYDARRRELNTMVETMRAEQNKIGRETGPQLGKLKRELKNAESEDRAELEAKIKELESRPATLKAELGALQSQLTALQMAWDALIVQVPLPPDPEVPQGESEADNVQLRTWNPLHFDPANSFEKNRGFAPKTHLDLVHSLDLVDFERGVKIGGTRHYILKGAGMMLHQAVLRFALDHITQNHGFTPLSVPVIVKHDCMLGTGFFPSGFDQAYEVNEARRNRTGKDLYLTGTGEVGLMGLHADEILDEDQLPLKYCTLSTCFRREAGAAGRDTAGLYRIHQFDKVEQVIITRNDREAGIQWHQSMIAIVEELLQKLELPYRLLQCCTGDLGAKNADMIDIECWMPGRGDIGEDGLPTGAYGETHSASRLNDFQCRRLNLRYRNAEGRTVFCHSLNNTVIASPRILIPILEMYQNEDGTITIPEALRPYLHGQERIEPKRTPATATS